VAQQLHFEKHLLGGSARSLKLAFVVDPLADLKAWKDSSVAMMRAAENHGHEVLRHRCRDAGLAQAGWRPCRRRVRRGAAPAPAPGRPRLVS
jgi:hypothetical protein